MTAPCLLAALLAVLLVLSEHLHRRERAALFRRLGPTPEAPPKKRTRHLSPHRTAIEKMKGKESAMEQRK